MKQYNMALAALLGGISTTIWADQLISDDLVVQSSLCVGADCVVDEDFADDTIRIKTATPQLRFVDTSGTGAFPSYDWVIGISDEGTATPANFFIENITDGLRVLEITPSGDVAMGGGAAAVKGAVSVGDLGNERRVTNVADGIADTDAVTLGQFITFKSSALTSVGADAATLDATLTSLDTRVTELSARVDKLVSAACGSSC